ncbi:MAG TPA: Clp protease N-terminal domain-containing protein [Candidatus Limnocylindrales bacterium]|nr:Clp protease N-terminal domain-containing protein [Candidatus Limnocylindrales bacterium]
MYERLTQSARRAIFFAAQDARAVRSAYIEPEHLLLGIISIGQPELGETMPFKRIEPDLRARLHPLPLESTSIRADIPISNVCKRCLAYAAEEAERLSSKAITPGHLLLGILREPNTLAAQVLEAHHVDLTQARAVISGLPPQNDFSLLQIEKITLQRRLKFITVGQLATLAAFAVFLSQTSLSARQLLWIGGIWVCVVVLWSATYRSWNVDIKTQHRRVALTVIQALLWGYGLLLSGWIIPIVLGIWRTFRR